MTQDPQPLFYLPRGHSVRAVSDGSIYQVLAVKTKQKPQHQQCVGVGLYGAVGVDIQLPNTGIRMQKCMISSGETRVALGPMRESVREFPR